MILPDGDRPAAAAALDAAASAITPRTESKRAAAGAAAGAAAAKRAAEAAGLIPAGASTTAGANGGDTAAARPIPVMLVLVGAPGSGKSTLAASLTDGSAGQGAVRWGRVNQDTIANGKRGSRQQCLKRAEELLTAGTSAIIDRYAGLPSPLATWSARNGFAAGLLLMNTSDCALAAVQLITVTTVPQRWGVDIAVNFPAQVQLRRRPAHRLLPAGRAPGRAAARAGAAPAGGAVCTTCC